MADPTPNGKTAYATIRELQAVKDVLIAEMRESERRLIEKIDALTTETERMHSQVGVWRGIILFLGLPGLLGLAMILIGFATGQTVTGPGGVLR